MSRSGAEPPAAAAAPVVSPAVPRLLSGPWFAVLLGLVCFLNSLGGDFVYDDTAIIRDNPAIRDPADFRAIWLTDWWGAIQAQQIQIDNPRRDRLYRPLTTFTFALNYAAGGLSPFGYRLVNVLLHAACCALVWLLAFRLFADRRIAAAAAILFAVHPVHCEAVAQVVGRAEVLAALFLLAGLLALLPRAAPPSLARLVLAAALFMLALLAKETAICYPAVALLALHYHAGKPGRTARRPWLAAVLLLVLPVVLYLALRYQALGGHLIRDQAVDELFNPVAAGGAARWLMPLTILGHYVRLLVAPSALSSDYGWGVLDPDRPVEWLTFVGGLAAVGLLAALRGYRRGESWPRRAAVCSALFLASYALISNTGLLIGVSLAERLFYWPSVPALLLAAVLGAAAWERWCAPGRVLAGSVPLLRILGLLLPVALGLRTVARNYDWTSNLLLFQADVTTYPQAVLLQRATARELLIALPRENDPRRRQALLDAAARHAQYVVERRPRFFDGHYLMARICQFRGDLEAARRYADNALRLMPGDPRMQQLNRELAGAGEDQARRDALRKQLAADPADTAARVELARLLLAGGQLRDALQLLEDEAAARSDDPELQLLRAEALTLAQQEPRAIELYERVLTLRPDEWRAHANLANLLAGARPADALRHAQRAFELQPNDLRANVNLAEALAVNGRTAEALARYRAIRSGLAPDDPFAAAVAERIRELERQP